MAIFNECWFVFALLIIVPEIVANESMIITEIPDQTTATPASSFSKTNTSVDNEDLVIENGKFFLLHCSVVLIHMFLFTCPDKRRANELIKSMRRLPGWYLTNNKMNNYKQHAQFANGWRAVPLPKSKVPIRMHSAISSVAIPVVVPIITTSTTEQPIPTTTTTKDVELSSDAFSPMPMHTIQQKPMIVNDRGDDNNNQTYESKAFCLFVIE